MRGRGKSGDLEFWETWDEVDGSGEIGMEAPGSKEDESMEDEERGERERLLNNNQSFFLVVR